MAKEKKKDKNKTTTVSESTQVMKHYDDADAELTERITHKERGYDTYQKIYRNYINPSQWPFGARVPDGRGATIIDRKTDRLLGNRLQGRFIPTKHGTELGARVATELILYQWNEIDLCSGSTMLSRWRMMDSRARRFGTSFGRWSWRRVYGDSGATIFDGPWFEAWDNKNVLTQPGVRNLDESDYIILRYYPTISQLEQINEMAKTGPIYDPEAIKYLKEKDSSTTHYESVDRRVVGLNENSEAYGRVEVCTEYNQTKGKWITYTPMQGKVGKEAIILKSIENPYNNLGTIPVVALTYYPTDDDIIGKPELESVMPLIKTNWAFLSQYLEALQDELFTPIMVNPTQVQLDTLKYKAGARWLMNKPGADVVPLTRSSSVTQKFVETFGLTTSLIMEGVGETAQDVSQIAQSVTDKTATEVKDLAMLRTARDNANKAILSQAIAKQVSAWFRMDQKMMTGSKLVRVVGKDALEYLVNEGLHNWTLSSEGAKVVSDFASENQETVNGIAKDTGREPFEIAYEMLRAQGALDQHTVPIYPMKEGNETVPQLRLEKDGKSGFLSVDPKSIQGDYNFLVDIQAMSVPNDASEVSARQMFFDSALKVRDSLAAEGYQMKFKDLLEDIGNTAKLNDPEKYFEKLPQQQTTTPQPPTSSMPMNVSNVGAQGGV